MDIASKLARRVAFLSVVVFFIGAKAPEALDLNTLAAQLKRELPKGWNISIEKDRVVLRRAEPVELYNALAMPPFGEKEEIKRRVFRDKLTISFSLEDHITADEFKQMWKQDLAAVAQVRREKRLGKGSPDADFWKQHPEYGYKDLPMFDAGSKSIYLDSNYPCLYNPAERADAPGTLCTITMFYDKHAGEECQGILDRLGKIYRPYHFQ